MQTGEVQRPGARTTLIVGGLFVLMIGGCAVLGVLIAGTSGGGGAPSGAEQGQQWEGVVRLSGTEGMPYTCAIRDPSGEHSIEGRVPDEIKSQAGITTSFAATCRKRAAKGTLTASLVVAGHVREKQTTTAEYGVVTLDYLDALGD